MNEGANAGRVVIVGAGFAGLTAAQRLGRAGIPTTVVDRRNHHLFQPLLYQVATAALSPADIAEPIRKMLRRYSSVDVRFGEAAGIEGGTLLLADGGRLPFDRLVLATGAEYGYFGHDEWAEAAPGLKTIEDARTIRSRLLLAFERAEATDDAAERDRLMTVAIVGGGATGVEVAGAVAELARHALARDFRRIRPEAASIVLIEAGPRLLAGFSEAAASFARERLERLGVSVRLDAPVRDIGDGGLIVADGFLPAETIVWAAGVKATPAGTWLGVETDRAGRIPVNPDLSVVGRERVYALGDLALTMGTDGKPLPGLAQVAKQQGDHLGRMLARELNGGPPPEPFRFRDRGNAAIVGRHAAIFETGRLRLHGRTAWALWALIHIYLLAGFQHRATVAVQWLWRYLTYERGARLIGEDRSSPHRFGEPAAEQNSSSERNLSVGR